MFFQGVNQSFRLVYVAEYIYIFVLEESDQMGPGWEQLEMDHFWCTCGGHPDTPHTAVHPDASSSNGRCGRSPLRGPSVTLKVRSKA